MTYQRIMKIANWNVERLKHKSQVGEITGILEELNADILVLTETDQRIQPPNFLFKVSTPQLAEIEPDDYKETENRVTIFSNYEIVNQFATYDKYTSLCVELKTEFGNLKVYGTIIGIYGNRNENFNIELKKQLLDFEKLSVKQNLCVIGDYNISFSDNYYFTKFGRNQLIDSCNKIQINILTKDIKACIDHIAISAKFCNKFSTEISEWNIDKKLSDHKGVLITTIPLAEKIQF